MADYSDDSDEELAQLLREEAAARNNELTMNNDNDSKIISPGLKGRALTKSKIHQFHQNQSNVLRMRGRNILAVMKDVPIRYRKVDFV